MAVAPTCTNFGSGCPVISGGSGDVLIVSTAALLVALPNALVTTAVKLAALSPTPAGEMDRNWVVSPGMSTPLRFHW